MVCVLSSGEDMICPEFYVAEVIENTRNQDFMFEETFKLHFASKNIELT